MTNEIKEILDDLDYCKNMKAGNILLKYNECDLLLDYITNLQEENERLTNARYSLDRVELEKRIDKAVEYIINHTQSTAHLEMDTKSIKQLLDILRGDE